MLTAMRRAALALALLLALPSTAFAVPRHGARAAAAMASLPAGSYRPLYGRAGGERVTVVAFRLDRTPVTRGEYLDFLVKRGLLFEVGKRQGDFGKPVMAYSVVRPMVQAVAA